MLLGKPKSSILSTFDFYFRHQPGIAKNMSEGTDPSYLKGLSFCIRYLENHVLFCSVAYFIYTMTTNNSDPNDFFSPKLMAAWTCEKKAHGAGRQSLLQ